MLCKKNVNIAVHYVLSSRENEGIFNGINAIAVGGIFNIGEEKQDYKDNYLNNTSGIDRQQNN